jgi:hypothetical protein
MTSDYDASVGERPMKLIHFVFKKLNWFVLSRFIFSFLFCFLFAFFVFLLLLITTYFLYP